MDLREYVDKVKEIGELKLIEGADWNLEIGAITFLAGTDPKLPALLFDKIKGYDAGYRVLAIPYSSDKRIALSLGLPVGLEKLELVKKLRDKMGAPFEPIPPREVKNGPALENVHTGDDVDLFEFPTPKWQKGDGGRYIGTGDIVIIKDPDEGWVNIGVHRVEIHDKTTATIMFEDGKHGDMIRKKYWDRGLGCPAAVVCGCDPLLVFVGGLRVPWGVSEYDYAGWFSQKPVDIIKGPVTGLPIPADSEIVFEGEMVSPTVDSRMEGPFSEGTGHYTPALPEAAFKVKCVLHRNNPIILADLPFLGPGIAAPGFKNVQRAAMLWSHLDTLITGIKGVWSPPEWNRTAIISITQKYGGHAKQAAVAALGKFSYNQKYIVVVDDDIDPSNIREVLFALAERADPGEFDIIRENWCNHLTPLLSPDQRNAGDITENAALIMACKPYKWIKQFPPMVKADASLQEEMRKKWGKVLFG